MQENLNSTATQEANVSKPTILRMPDSITDPEEKLIGLEITLFSTILRMSSDPDFDYDSLKAYAYSEHILPAGTFEDTYNALVNKKVISNGDVAAAA